MPPVGKSGPGTTSSSSSTEMLGFVDHADHRVADFAQIVRRNRSRHAHCDAVGAVDQQIRKPRRQHGRLAVPLVVGRNEIDRVELQVVEHQRRDRRHAGLSIPHGRRGQSGDRAEIALLVDQHVAHVPILGHAHQRGINDRFAVRMIVTASVAADLGTLDSAGARRQVQIVHRHQDSPLRRLQPVAHVRQRPADDDAHRVRQVAIFELFFDRQVDEPAEHRIHIARGSLNVFGFVAVGRQNQSFQKGLLAGLKTALARAHHAIETAAPKSARRRNRKHAVWSFRRPAPEGLRFVATNRFATTT